MAKYVVGDLCNCLDSDDWFEYCNDETLPEGAYSFRTAFGDGTYVDGEGREYGVDSGTIGALPLEKVSHRDKLKTALKYRIVHVIDLPELIDGDCSEVDGVITFGPIVIPTA